ncbi:phytoene/squalene synthase family protein [Camelimonas abortus]|uniref:Phytoene/squalene synthase family protein n=1 Tax=Camelimonas abortus TaxID=1017184 RepID=A0ABV7LF70_9HYPH
MAGQGAAGALQEAYRHCQDVTRDGERDRYLATLLAPEPARPALFALYAFAHEAARVRAVVKQPLAGEIRLQWWRDVIAGEGRGEVAASPVAAALLDVIDRYDLPRQAFLDLLDARAFDLYDDPMPDVASLEGYCGETSSALLRLASLILAGGGDPGGGDAPGHGGVALAIAGLLRGLPWSARMGQCFVPVELLARHGASRDDIVAGRDTPAVRAALADMRALAQEHYRKFVAALSGSPRAVHAAFLPVATTPLYLARLSGDWRPFADVTEPAQWRRQWRLWRAARGAWAG